MIGDSIPWKEELLKVADSIARRADQQRWTERTGFLVERDVMVGAFAIRKLLDAPGKISVEELLRVFRNVGDDDVVSVDMRRDADGHMQVIRASQSAIEPGRSIS